MKTSIHPHKQDLFTIKPKKNPTTTAINLAEKNIIQWKLCKLISNVNPTGSNEIRKKKLQN